MRLNSLAPGQTGVVVDVDGPLRRTLLEMGFVPGTRVRVVKAAPLGDPAELALRGYRLCVRRRVLERIRIVRAAERVG